MASDINKSTEFVWDFRQDPILCRIHTSKNYNLISNVNSHTAPSGPKVGNIRHYENTTWPVGSKQNLYLFRYSENVFVNMSRGVMDVTA